MIQDDYKSALKRGQKAYKEKVLKGQYPYLPVLDTIIPETRILQGVSIGTVNVPADFIVGTRTSGRTQAFACNFMPLMGENTEFALKWTALCQAHLNEGIRDPLKVYEYMNRFYVEEGNKRASVLKYFQAVEVRCEVIRVMPVRTDETEPYYEFLEFNKKTKINFLEFSKKGSYAELTGMLGKQPGDEWSEEEISGFKKAYFTFKKAFYENGGQKLDMTVGDAMLVYIRIYGYEDLKLCTAKEMKEFISRVWEEITLVSEDEPIQVQTEPSKKTEPGKLNDTVSANTLGTMKALSTGQVIGTAPVLGVSEVISMLKSPKTCRVAFIYDKTPEESGWTYAHELGRQHVQTVFSNDIVTTAYFNALDGNPLAPIERAIADGNKLIFTTSPRLRDASLRAAVDHPSVTIFNCSLNASHRYIRSYYSRMYEAKFIIGAIAGSMSEKGRIGYICDYPIYGQIAGINAFALGAQLVNPRAEVYLEWSSVCGETEARKRLTDNHIHLISALDVTKLQGDERNSFGLFRHHHDNTLTNLAAPVWQWGQYYERIIRGYLNKSEKEEYKESSKALNYYWGMAAGVIDIFESEKLPVGTHRLITLLKNSIIDGRLHPFQGKVTMQDGTVIDYGEGGLAIEKIMNMDTLAANVVGEIPAYNKLSDAAKPTVDAAGLQEAKLSEDEKKAAEGRKAENEKNARILKVETEKVAEKNAADGIVGSVLKKAPELIPGFGKKQSAAGLQEGSGKKSSGFGKSGKDK